jgi:hypothetical protein
MVNIEVKIQAKSKGNLKMYFAINDRDVLKQ